MKSGGACSLHFIRCGKTRGESPPVEVDSVVLEGGSIFREFVLLVAQRRIGLVVVAESVPADPSLGCGN